MGDHVQGATMSQLIEVTHAEILGLFKHYSLTDIHIHAQLTEAATNKIREAIGDGYSHFRYSKTELQARDMAMTFFAKDIVRSFRINLPDNKILIFVPEDFHWYAEESAIKTYHDRVSKIAVFWEVMLFVLFVLTVIGAMLTTKVQP